MSDLDAQLRAAVGCRVSLPGHFAEPVTIDNADYYPGAEVVSLRVHTTRGQPKDATVNLPEFLAALQQAAAVPRVALVKPDDQFMVVESARIRLAYAWDPYFAVSLSGIEALPHQLEAVYQRMLPQARLRFLLADDPGAGKTIMAGLLLKELRLRGVVDRTLILCPAPLTLQWQDELQSKFDETFEIVDSHAARGQLAGSPWAKFPQCIASVDFAKQEHIAPELLRERWDLLIIDEAHKVASADVENPTIRYQLARELVNRAERLLFLTATPHQGNPEQFHNLLRLIDEHAFRTEKAVKLLLKQENSPWILRRMKEDLRDFEGKKLFVKRNVFTQDFTLNEHEWALYEAVTDYINTFLPRQAGRKKQSAALVRMVFQRRLASSLRAIRLSIEKRHARLKDLLEELNALPKTERERRLKELANLRADPELEADDETEEKLDEAAQQAIISERYDQLQAEVPALARLLEVAVATERRGVESKLNKLFACLERAEFDEVRDQSGKLIIFTEQRATLDYLKEHLEARKFRCCVIHGGMDAVARKAAQKEFQLNAQICIATDAAGEGINLQFCHLMFNYDMPWNPTRLEQRMGRIHRFGQKREVYVFNFVAVAGPRGPEEQPVVEGRVLQRLLEKLDEIRESIGDRVFDVIGMLLKVNNVVLEDVLREATYNPRLLDDYVDEIEKLDERRLAEYEEATGIALAKRSVDLTRIRGADFESEERRLMPEYVEDHFLKAAEMTGLRVARRANPALLRIEHVPQKFTARNLVAVRTRGEAHKVYSKASFLKRELMKAENLDGELLSPGHALYAAVDEVLNLDLKPNVGGVAHWIDPRTREPYRLHFFELDVEGESLGDPGEPPRSLPVHARLVAVQESLDGSLEEAQPDILHDLTPVPEERRKSATTSGSVVPTPDELRRIEGWLRATVQHRLVEKHRADRAQEVEIRRKFLKEAFAASIKAAQRRQMDLHARVMEGEKEASLARDGAAREVAGLEATRDHRMRSLDHMAVVRSGRLAHLASAVVDPPAAGTGVGMQNDPEVELFAIDFVARYEDSQHRDVEHIWKLKDGSGFDLRSVGRADGGVAREVRRIEVKGRGADRGEVNLSPNEWRQAQRLHATYWLYVVWGCKTGHPRLKMILDPWSRLRDQTEEVVAVKGYRIPDAALSQAEGEEWTG